VILDDIEDLMNPHKVTQDWYYQSAYQKMLSTLKVWDFEKVVQHKIDSLQELYTTARELSSEQLTLLLELAIVILILWEVISTGHSLNKSFRVFGLPEFPYYIFQYRLFLDISIIDYFARNLPF